MSWLSKMIPKSVKKVATAASFVVPGVALMAPVGGTKQVTNAVKGLATGAAIAATSVAAPKLIAAAGIKTAAPATTSALVKQGAAAAVKGLSTTAAVKTAAPAITSAPAVQAGVEEKSPAAAVAAAAALLLVL